MHRTRQSIWYKVFVLWMSVLLAMSGIPTLPAHAQTGASSSSKTETSASGSSKSAGTQTPTEADDPFGSTLKTGSASTTAAEQSTDDASASRVSSATSTSATTPATAPDATSATNTTAPAEIAVAQAHPTNSVPEGQTAPAGVSAFATGTLTQTAKAPNGHTFTVTVAFDESAHIPAGTKLSVRIPDDAEDRASRLEAVLDLAEDDRMLGAAYVHVSLEKDGVLVAPATSVEVTIETNDVAPARSAAVEVAMLGESGHRYVEAPEADEQVSSANEAVPEDEAQPVVDESLACRNLTPNEAKATNTKLAFSTQQLGTVALASVVTRHDLWDYAGLAVSVLLPRLGLNVTTSDASAPQLEAGVDPLACYAITADPNPTYGTTVWLEATRTDDGVGEGVQVPGGVVAYRLANHTMGDKLFDYEGTQAPVALNAKDEQLLLVWDSGYRSASLRMSNVTVAGMMPEDTHGTALDVAQAYDDPATLMAGLSDEAAAEVTAGIREVEAIAGYDITLSADGEEYQPDDDHPLTVTIADDAITQGKDLQVWHITDDGTVEVIPNVKVVDGSVSFEAPGFSTYLLVAQAETATTATSTFFRIKASAKTFARTTKVTFVDENKNPINGTIMGTLNVSYTGTGPDSNSTNTIDMYSFADKLDPQIADEYDFSRVFVQLTATNQKDCRYIQVADDTAINSNGNTSVYRAYLYQESIEQNKSGQDYNGTWYQLSNGGDIDNMYIEFYHVGPASFYALDTRNDPVPGAEFALYTDPECYTPFEYKHAEVKATSDKRGLVSFGKIPRGTYYMKETVVPENYKKTTTIYQVVVDGKTPLANIIHQDDDGSVIIAEVLEMTLKKEWDDNLNHDNDSVDITVYADGDVVKTVTLKKEKNWTETLKDLDPNKAYMVSETCVRQNNVVKTSDWMPHIEYLDKESHAEYFKADSFKKGKQYVTVTKTYSGTRALDGSTNLTTTPLEVDETSGQITGTVTDGMIWNVDTITRDGIVALKNESSQKYLDKGSTNTNNKWYLNPDYPVPLYVRHINNNGVVKFYHRQNLNIATSNYLYVWYTRGNKAEGSVDNYGNDESKAASFDIYRKVNVRTVDVTIKNRTTRYPIRMRNVAYPRGDGLSGMSYDLYSREGYDAGEDGVPLIDDGLVAGEDGYLRNKKGDQVQFDLSSGTYYLRQTGSQESYGYAPLTKPVKFTITRNGVLRVALEDQEIADFNYATTMTVGDTTVPVLQIPNNKPVTVEVALDVEGDFADLTRPFEFDLTLPEGVSTVSASIDGVATTFTEDNHSFALAHGQSLRLIDVPATEEYILTQTSPNVAATKQAGDGLYATTATKTADTVTVTQATDDARKVTLSGIQGTSEEPARVTITNTLGNADVPATGILDNTPIWAAVVVACLCLMAVLLRRRVR